MERELLHELIGAYIKQLPESIRAAWKSRAEAEGVDPPFDGWAETAAETAYEVLMQLFGTDFARENKRRG